LDPQQLQIDWTGGAAAPPTPEVEISTARVPPSVQPNGLTLKLKWDFKTSFPPPTQEALDAGTMSDEDAEPENLRAIHDEHARELLMTLHDLDAVLDARRRGVDPRNNKAPMLAEAKERLQKFFQTEPARLEQWFKSLMDTYESAFGAEAADAFGKAVRAWDAGVDVIDESRPAASLPVPANEPEKPPEISKPEPAPVKIPRKRNPARIIAKLPVPRPLPSAVAAGHFGQEENGRPVRPGAREVRDITEQHAEKLIDLIDTIRSGPMNGKEALQEQFAAGIAAYAEDFGQHAADQLQAYVLRQAGLDSASRHQR
jgi:hypothetical protein